MHTPVESPLHKSKMTIYITFRYVEFSWKYTNKLKIEHRVDVNQIPWRKDLPYIFLLSSANKHIRIPYICTHTYINGLNIYGSLFSFNINYAKFFPKCQGLLYFLQQDCINQTKHCIISILINLMIKTTKKMYFLS